MLASIPAIAVSQVLWSTRLFDGGHWTTGAIPAGVLALAALELIVLAPVLLTLFASVGSVGAPGGREHAELLRALLSLAVVTAAIVGALLGWGESTLLQLLILPWWGWPTLGAITAATWAAMAALGQRLFTGLSGRTGGLRWSGRSSRGWRRRGRGR